MRRQLNKLRQLRGAQSLRTSLNKAIVESLDNDDSEGPQAGIEARGSGCELGECQMSCSEDVVRKEHLWKIEGMSWLTTALDDMNRDFVSTPGKYTIAATGDEVDFVYHPCGGVVDCMDDGYGDYCASLAMRFWKPTCSSFRYRIFVRRSDGEFVQWGPEGDESCPAITGVPFGPDVVPAPAHGLSPAKGVFGLSHAELLKSQWVNDDTLTVRFELEVRPCARDIVDDIPTKRLKVSVPPPSLAPNLLSLLEDGRRSDLAFVLKGERLKAHSLVLAARCEVFDSLLQSGMRESESKEVVVEDCEPDVFRAFLRFLYSDDFSQVQTCMESESAKISSEGGGAEGLATTNAAFLQGVLSVSHKYQVSRLALWCEQQLCDLIAAENVCATWLQAHLHEAKRLEEICLAYIKENIEKVASTPSFVKVSSAWPQLPMKLSLLTTGVSSDSAASVLSAHEDALRKRKRE